MMELMPTPIGHVLAGVAVALATDTVSPSLWRPVSFKTGMAMLAALAALPDLDLIYPAIHRAFTHSVGSIVLVTIIGAVVTGWVTGRRSIGIGVLCGVAWASHLVMDWLGVDPNPPFGIKALWPFSDGWFISSLQIFPGTERRQVFSAAAFATNFYAVAVEIAILTPVVVALWAAWLAASRRRSRACTAGGRDWQTVPPGGDHA
jgi:inner membrane protein